MTKSKKEIISIQSVSKIYKLGETVVIATAVGAKKLNEGQDYFPLSVNYQEKYYAAGKIPGGYFKREARPCLLYTSPSPRDRQKSRMPSSA